MNLIDVIRKACRAAIRKLAAWLNRLSGGKLTPNMVTYVGTTMHIPIAVLIAQGRLDIAAVLLVIFGLFDVLDGELARIQKSASNAGMLLDASTDRLKEAMLYSGVAYYITSGDHPTWAFVAVLACGISITSSFVKARGEIALALQKHLTDHHALNHHFKQTLAPFEVRMAILAIGLLADQVIAACVLIAVLALISIVTLYKAIIKEL